MTTQVATYVAGRRLKIHPGYREPGELVVEAHTWFRPDEWLHSGYIKETTVTERVFRHEVNKRLPNDQHQFVYDKVGLNPDVVVGGNLGTPRVREVGEAPEEPVALKAKAKPKD